jgi:hypothetical protein
MKSEEIELVRHRLARAAESLQEADLLLVQWNHAFKMQNCRGLLLRRFLCCAFLVLLGYGLHHFHHAIDDRDLLFDREPGEMATALFLLPEQFF